MKLIHAAAFALLPAMLNADTGIRSSLYNSGQVSISIKLKGLPDGAHVYLLSKKDADLSNTGSKYTDTIMAATAANEKVEFKTGIDEPGKMFAVAIRGQKAVLSLLIGANEKVTANGVWEEWPKMKVSGSAGTAQMAKFRDYFTSVILQKEGGAAISKSIIDFVAANPDNLYVPLVLLQNVSMTNDERSTAFDKLSAKVKNSYYGKKLAIAMSAGALNQPLRENYLIPDFKLRMLSGDTMSIRQIAAKNKLTLIDYWATWCGPCVGEFPHLKELYARFRDKGLGIVGITRNENESGLRKAIDNYGITWLQGVDEIDNVWGKIFKIHSVPVYALIDQEGKMIAFLAYGSDASAPFGPYIFGEKLDKALEEILR